MFLKYIQIVIYFSFVYSQWSYEEQNKWSRSYGSCGGNRQSPINIKSNQLKRNPYLNLDLINYDIPRRRLILRNTGHTAEITLNSRSPPLTIGVGPDPYVFQNMHFHWGDNNLKGTEHSIDNYFGSAELHFVHYKQSYGSLSKALRHSDGIVVITVIFELSREPNPALRSIIRSIPKIINNNSSTVIPQYNFSRLLPRNRNIFYKYLGSLTTPPCSEAVNFVIFANPLRMSPFQLSQFRRLLEEPNHKLVSNTRNIQPLNNRVVEVSVPRFSRDVDDLDNFDNFYL